jgi:hypothetical protein
MRPGASPGLRCRGRDETAVADAVAVLLCEDVLAEEGITDFDAYSYVRGATPQVDLFVDHL